MKCVYSQKGLSLVEVLVSVSIVSILAVLTLGVNANFLQKNDYLRSRAIAQILKENIIGVMKSEQAILYTSRDTTFNFASNFSCIVNSTDCIALNTIDSPFALKTADNLLFMGSYDPLNPSHGFSPDGKPCTTFTSAATGSKECPFRYTFTWTPLCGTAATCIKPQILMKARFVYNPGPSDPPINTDSFSFSLYKGFSDDISIKAVCDIVKGVFDPTNRTCQIDFLNFTCPGTTGFTGGVNGVPVCTAY